MILYTSPSTSSFLSFSKKREASMLSRNSYSTMTCVTRTVFIEGNKTAPSTITVQLSSARRSADAEKAQIKRCVVSGRRVIITRLWRRLSDRVAVACGRRMDWDEVRFCFASHSRDHSSCTRRLACYMRRSALCVISIPSKSTQRAELSAGQMAAKEMRKGTMLRETAA